ncbi:hypothetical protein RHMOL_Rhmol03G0176400 [Rhododendron molle]|uniref:Uncharacterized protein n=1 Tax=Rhododendron molle TaxID=49168 RepID=A0ACC0PHT8_RHOML|nr:hypothetical protein RHMOL_Rhmol03G0176400 [Rhododendron molle]
MVGQKRSGGAEFEEKSELVRFDTNYPNSKANHLVFSYGKEKSLEASKDAATTNPDVAPGELTRSDSHHFPQSHCLGLNTKFSAASNSAGGDMPTSAHTLSSFRKYDTENGTFAESRGFSWDLNAEDISNSLNQNPFYPFKNHEHLKSDDASECGSTTGSLEEKDHPTRMRKEMKQNGYLSSSHGGITVPKPRRRKGGTDGLKKKMELARREQIDRFAKIAAPSELLNELNPGIINHVRNSKQVHSIIEAMVRSEKLENPYSGGQQAISMNSGSKEITERKKDTENVTRLGMKQTGHYREDASLSTLSGIQQKSGFTTLSSESLQFNSDDSRKDGDLSNIDGSWLECGAQNLENPRKTTWPLDTKQHREDDMLALKLSSCITMASENPCSLSNESVNATGVSCLSVKAANVASRWLELLHQDTKGRLTALRRSKKRVRAVIHTDLPLLMSMEFSSNQENDPCVMKASATGCSDNANADVHRARWSALFDQMDKSLSDEEKRLEILLNQVKDMQLHCERGLKNSHHSTLHGSQQLGVFENDSRVEEADNAQRELAVIAAAASIYSTSNFMLSK